MSNVAWDQSVNKLAGEYYKVWAKNEYLDLKKKFETEKAENEKKKDAGQTSKSQEEDVDNEDPNEKKLIDFALPFPSAIKLWA